ncbi:MAG: peptide chain release factor N(5)-glutamine methyltransferase [Steroidobacteraceae bacterium]
MTRTAIEPSPPTLAALLVAARRRLAEALCADANGTPQLDAELLLAEVLGRSRAYLAAHPEALPDADAQRRFQDLIERRAAGEPVAYLLGRKGFWTFELEVSPAVLVPRPETELLIERVLALRPAAHGRVADLGTGSGAIAIALALERPGWTVVASDLSPEALTLARRNAARLAPGRIELHAGSWCAALPAGAFDLLVSNPPYIAAADPAFGALRCEPALALVSGPDGLGALRQIIAAAPAHLTPGGWLLLEHGAAQGEAVADELAARGFVTVRTHRDLAGRERMTEGQWPAIR